MKFFMILALSIISLNALADKHSKATREPSSAGSFVCGRLELELSDVQIAAKLSEKCDSERYVQLFTGSGGSASTPVKYCCVLR